MPFLSASFIFFNLDLDTQDNLTHLNLTPNEEKKKKGSSCKVLTSRPNHVYAVKDKARPVATATSERTRPAGPDPPKCPPHLGHPRTTTNHIGSNRALLDSETLSTP